MRDSSAIIVGSDAAARSSLQRFLKTTCGLGTVSEVADGRGGLHYLEQTRFDLVLLDRETFRGFDEGLVRTASRANGRVPIVVVTLLRNLAAFVRRLFEPSSEEASETREQLSNAALGRLLDYARERSEVVVGAERAAEFEAPDASRAFSREQLFREMGHSEAVERLADQIEKVGPTSYSVLVAGETGVGKELVARGVHRSSRRGDQRFVAIDCGAVSDSLVESELFGHVKGAFTDAEEARPGKFRLADGGTLFMDEISTMSRNLQGTVLRALEQSAFYPVGGSEEIEVDVRVVAASNRDIRNIDSFRDDLYFRLAEYVIEVPPLRERKADIPHLSRKFLREASAELPHDVFELTTEAMERLKRHDWPGNVRELRNTIRQAALEAEDGSIRAAHLRQLDDVQTPDFELDEEVETGEYSLKELVQNHREKLERKVIRRVMAETGGNMAETARKLKVNYKTIYNKVKEYGIGGED